MGRPLQSECLGKKLAYHRPTCEFGSDAVKEFFCSLCPRCWPRGYNCVCLLEQNFGRQCCLKGEIWMYSPSEMIENEEENEKLYAGLQDLSKERRKRLDEILQLYDFEDHEEENVILEFEAEEIYEEGIAVTETWNGIYEE